ncbi:MAG: tetratricopeptide repeat protein [Deltaproteobacteria bacterium]|nr:tetratricopeptide repeat protein [Deltaproteobacteria bacterium]
MSRRQGWGQRLGLGAVALAVVCVAFPALAGPGSDVRTEVSEIEQQTRTLSVRHRTQAASSEQLAEHRLVDAQVLYNLRDYTRAAIILLDYVNRFKNTRGYPEAVFFLADSLYNKRDFLSARRYFQLIVSEVRGKYYQEALQRLIELSLRTGDTAEVNTYLSLLGNIPADQLKPSVPYVKGKFYYFKGDLDTAASAFRAISQGHTYYHHAQYFLGAIYVRRKDHAGAMRVYQDLLRVPTKSGGDQQVRQLTYLALGRLLYEKGKIAEAIDQYQRVDRRSKEFDTALYEICWAFVKAGEFQKASRALDLLMLAHPDSPFIPEVRVLQGNLLIRLKEWGKATDLFSKTREQFHPAQARMAGLLATHKDPNVFFDALLARNTGEMSITIQVPELALNWVKELPNVGRALGVVTDVREMQGSVSESKELIERLERAINSPARIKIFPEFASARTSSLELENRVAHARRRILAEERRLIEPVATGTERDQLASLYGKRATLERLIEKLPVDAAGISSREQTKIGQLVLLDRQISELQVMVQSLRAQLVASEKYVRDTAKSAKADARESFRKETDEVRSIIAGLQAEVEELRKAVSDAKDASGVGGPEEVAERQLRAKYKEVVAAEHQFYAALRPRLGGAQGGEFDGLAGLLQRCASVEVTVDSFNQRLDQGVEQKLTHVRAVIKEERDLLEKYNVEVAEYKSQSDQVAGAVAYDGFRDIAKRFYEIVVRADVGIIDVAWALKDAKSKELSRLARQQKMDLKVLDDEFREVLKED